MIGHVFEDGAMVIAAVPEVVDFVGAATGSLGYRVIRRWYALMDRGRRKRPRWVTARVHGDPCDIDGCPLSGVIAPSTYVEPHLHDHEMDAYQDLLERAHIAPSLN